MWDGGWEGDFVEGVNELVWVGCWWGSGQLSGVCRLSCCSGRVAYAVCVLGWYASEGVGGLRASPHSAEEQQ